MLNCPYFQKRASEANFLIGSLVAKNQNISGEMVAQKFASLASSAFSQGHTIETTRNEFNVGFADRH